MMAYIEFVVQTLSTYVPPELVSWSSRHVKETQAQLAPLIHSGQAWINQILDGFDSASVVLLCIVAIGLGHITWAVLAWALRPIRERGFLPALFETFRSLPIIRSKLQSEKAKITKKILDSRAAQGADPLVAIPEQGRAASEVRALLRQRAAADVQIKDDGQLSVTLSGAVYIGSPEHKALLDSAYCAFSFTNPLHAEAFPSVRTMEAEVVAMTAALLGGGPKGPNPAVCGAMTSGGTESILSAVKASRDYMLATRGVRQPEMIIGVSAHAAYWKAAEYFKIKLHVVPVGPDFRLRPAAVRRRLNANTAIVVASAPGFPHGLVDDVAAIAALARRAGVCCHVDACLGGYCLPFVEALGRRVPLFDFRLPGVTSMSVDTHKFGMAHKGTSVVLYASPELRRHQYTAITDWSGGLYISPGLAGSRPGALIATAWASLLHLGHGGLLDATRRILHARDTLVDGIQTTIPELEVIGEPEMGVVAFRARQPKRLNIYALNDWLTGRGWHMNALQAPPALHFCFTAMNAPAAGALVGALREGVAALAGGAGGGAAAEGGSAPLYGMANVIPDRGMVGQFLEAYQDAMLVP